MGKDVTPLRVSDIKERITKYHLKSSVFEVRSNITEAGWLPNL